jgi:NAD(P)-dependent dehydrogenase (short-subunit alcohol dehydrogenase family)
MTTNGRGLVIVTGASSGFGKAIALHLREGGFSVLAGVRRDEDAERLRARGLTPIRLDVTGPEQRAAARAEVGDRPLAGLVNNAEILRGGPLEFVPIDTLGANRYARTPASFVHRMGASTHDICSPRRNTRGQPLGTTKARLRLDTPVGVLPGGGWECPSG